MPARFLRVLLALSLLAFAFLVGASGCSRSNLNDYSLGDDGGLPDGLGDAPPDGVEAGDSPSETGRCDLATCTNGCCDATGFCQTGDSLTQCGAGGEKCQDCQAEGFQVCDPASHACGSILPTCEPGSCNGCCVGMTCFAGTDPTECGVGAESCQNCQSQGLACTGGSCTPISKCGPTTCNGCCAGEACLNGNSPTACGVGGQACQSCTALGETCNGIGQCVGTPTCGPQNCGGGCCEGNVCTPGQNSQACGFGGQQCQDCVNFGETCQNQSCVPQTGCNPQTCPFGCCEGNFCTGGTIDSACGAGGGQCQNCASFGETCQNQVCVSQSTCNPQTCPNGCCEASPAGLICVSGTSDSLCGIGGLLCENCTGLGDTCQNQTCVGQGSCSPQTCPFGCCEFSACVAGTNDNACGAAGASCQSCTSIGDTCQNQTCVGPCNSQTCPFGCCQGNTCLPGSMDQSCGFNGQQCQDCQTSAQTCQNQTCLSACNPNNCQGCCDANQQCQPGFLNTQCGGFGATCANCTTLSPPSTCDQALFPPACASQQMTCPAPYGGCFAPPIQPLFPQPACSASDLQNAAAACAGGAYTTACQNFYNFEFSQNPACGQCLQPFDYNFSDNEGVYDCVAQFVSPACNQDTACSYDCTSQSCGQCPDQATFDQCEQSVAAGQCSSFASPAETCEQGAFSGPGAFCNPALYTTYGLWLQAVGTQYCGGLATDGGVGPG